MSVPGQRRSALRLDSLDLIAELRLDSLLEVGVFKGQILPVPLVVRNEKVQVIGSLEVLIL